jgi:hypothetical protein
MNNRNFHKPYNPISTLGQRLLLTAKYSLSYCDNICPLDFKDTVINGPTYKSPSRMDFLKVVRMDG